MLSRLKKKNIVNEKKLDVRSRSRVYECTEVEKHTQREGKKAKCE